MIRRAKLIVLLGLLAIAVGCGSEPPEAPAREQLATCPRGDTAWRAARDQAGREAGQLQSLLEESERLVGACTGRWEPLWLRGELLARLQRSVEAREAHVRGLDLARQDSDDIGVACCGLRVADQLRRSGDLARGRTHYREAVEASRRARRKDLEAFALNNFARLLALEGSLGESLQALEDSSRLLGELGLTAAQTRTAVNGAALAVTLGDAAQKERLASMYERGLEAGDERVVAATALTLGHLHNMLGDWKDAEVWYGNVSEAIDYYALRARLGQGQVALAMGEPRRAIATLATVAPRTDEPTIALIADCFAASAEIDLGQTKLAEQRLRTALDRAEELGNSRPQWLARWLLGRVLSRSGQHDAAIDSLQAAIDILESQAAQLERTDEGLRYFRERAEPYADLALAYLERDGALAADRLLEIARSISGRSFGNSSGPTSSRRIQAQLAGSEMLVAYILGKGQGVILGVHENGIAVRRLEGQRELRDTIQEFRMQLQAPLRGEESSRMLSERGRRIGAELYETLLAPVLQADVKTLYVAADRELALLPFAALPRPGGGYVGDIVDVAVVTGPSQIQRLEAPSSVYLAGAPDLSQTDEYEELSWAAFELDRLAGVWSDAVRGQLYGKDLTWDALRDAPLAEVSLVHLATHAEASTRDPRRSGIVVSRADLVGIDRIAELELRKALVVLSACRTGEGEIIPGEGVVGLRWAFLQAGAAAVVASQWVVDDEASARLMIAFHRRLAAGTPPIRALADARREIAASHPHPAFWAPFELVVAPN